MPVSEWWFNGWSAVARTVLVGACGYLALVAILRVAGKRTLSKMTAVDLVITVALGSILASLLLSSSTSLVQGIAGLVALVGLQTAVAWMSSRSPIAQRALVSPPTLLAYRGHLRVEVLRHERMSEAQVLAALRQAGFTRLDQTEAVVLESDGSLAVIARGDRSASVLDGVEGSAVRDRRR